MAFFQKTVTDKYLNSIDKQTIHNKFEQFKEHFHNIEKQKKYFLLPNYYLKFIGYLLYEYFHSQNLLVFLKAPSLYIKTTFKDISGNRYKLYYKVKFYSDFNNVSEVTFFIDEINIVKYIFLKF